MTDHMPDHMPETVPLRTRAASLILESEEDPADLERDLARFAAHDQDAPEGKQ